MKEYTVKVFNNGGREWYLNGKLHREDGPALDRVNGTKSWWLNGQLHREDGPAIEYPYGSKCWYLNGIAYSEEDFIKKTAKVTELTLDEIAEKFGISVDKLKIKK